MVLTLPVVFFGPLGVVEFVDVSNTQTCHPEVNIYPFGGLLETLAFAKSLRPEEDKHHRPRDFFFVVAENSPPIYTMTPWKIWCFGGGWNWCFFNLKNLGEFHEFHVKKFQGAFLIKKKLVDWTVGSFLNWFAKKIFLKARVAWTGWWFQVFFIFIPTWGNDPIWLAYFSKGLVQPPTSEGLLFTAMMFFPLRKNPRVGRAGKAILADPVAEVHGLCWLKNKNPTGSQRPVLAGKTWWEIFPGNLRVNPWYPGPWLRCISGFKDARHFEYLCYRIAGVYPPWNYPFSRNHGSEQWVYLR